MSTISWTGCGRDSGNMRSLSHEFRQPDSILLLHIAKLQQFISEKGIRPAALARVSRISRQHLLRLRKGEMEPTRPAIVALARACGLLLQERVRADELFDLD
jgi:DNA-binding phage protein